MIPLLLFLLVTSWVDQLVQIKTPKLSIVHKVLAQAVSLKPIPRLSRFTGTKILSTNKETTVRTIISAPRLQNAVNHTSTAPLSLSGNGVIVRTVYKGTEEKNNQLNTSNKLFCRN
jgi:hypothetical protein